MRGERHQMATARRDPADSSENLTVSHRIEEKSCRIRPFAPSFAEWTFPPSTPSIVLAWAVCPDHESAGPQSREAGVGRRHRRHRMDFHADG